MENTVKTKTDRQRSWEGRIRPYMTTGHMWSFYFSSNGCPKVAFLVIYSIKSNDGWRETEC